MPDNSNHVIIEVPNLLRDKVKTSGSNVITADVLENAEKVLLAMADDYLEWANSDLVRLQYAYGDLVEADTPETHNAAMEQVFAITHDMKGQGGTFGYTLVTQIGNYLCRLIERIDASTPVDIQNEAVRIHIDAIQLVISSELIGDGGEQGAKVLLGIEVMSKKLVTENPVLTAS